MTIKRRLFVSNILMLVIPIILTIIMSIGLLFVFIGMTGNYEILSSKHDGMTKYVADEVDELVANWTEDTKIETIKADIIDFYIAANKDPFENNFYIGLICFSIVIVVIYITNRILTQFVFRSIINPIDVLVYGVRQIHDGNLEYQIEYDEKDEFSGICQDFNEMAQRLSDIVKARLKDEANRKELIAGISHDLRTPLTSIKAYVEGIEKGVATTPVIQKKYIDIIKNKTTELECIINQLFMFSKVDVGEFPFNLEKLDLNEELRKFVEDISEEYEKNGLFVSCDIGEEKAYVNIDAQQFRNALRNISENSLKYKVKEQGKLEISTCVNENNITIELKDDGPGVPKDAVGKLFDIFYRVDPSRNNDNSGSGLGLAIAARVLERLDGSIRAENVEKGGLLIAIMFPLSTGGKPDEENINC